MVPLPVWLVYHLCCELAFKDTAANVTFDVPQEVALPALIEGVSLTATVSSLEVAELGVAQIELDESVATHLTLSPLCNVVVLKVELLEPTATLFTYH